MMTGCGCWLHPRWLNLVFGVLFFGTVLGAMAIYNRRHQ